MSVSRLSRLRRDDGQGLIELIVALTILAVGIGALLTVLTASALSLQRSDQKGTALTLAETQIERYRNVAFADIRLADASFSQAPLNNGADPYYTASATNTTIPSGAKSSQVTDTTAGTNPCGASPPVECQPVQTVTGPDKRRYRIDTYISSVTPKDSSGNVVGNPVLRVTVVVRNAQISTLPILAQNSSTFSQINGASSGGKSVPYLALGVPKAWVTANGTTIPSSSITATLSNGLSPTGLINFYVKASATYPSPPCGGSGWTPVGTATVNNGNATYQANSSFTVAAGNTYWWYATNSGDSQNTQRSSRCGPSTASTVVQATKWTPSISISAPATATTGIQVPASSITATLTSSSPGASGTIHIKYFGPGSAPSSCTSGGTELGTMSATGDGAYSQANPFPSTPAGNYWWYASYDGDSTNAAAASSCGVVSTNVGAGPTATGLQMFDTNGNGKIDQVVVTFDKAVSCSTNCTTGWTLANVPSGGTLSGVTTSGSQATLSLTEGSGAPDTSVGTFTLALNSTSKIVDSSGRPASFSATAPADKAGPVPIAISTTNKAGGTAGKAEAGDKVTVTFSEPIATIGGTTSTVTLATSNGGGKPVTLNMTNLSSAAFQIGVKNSYLTGNSGTSAVFGPTGSTVAASGSQVTVTLGTWGGAGSLSTGSYVAGNTGSFAPAATIKDAAGNAATGSLALTIGLF